MGEMSPYTFCQLQTGVCGHVIRVVFTKNMTKISKIRNIFNQSVSNMKRSRRINSNRALRPRENMSSACRLSNTELRMDMPRCQMTQEQTTVGTLGEFSRIIKQPKMVHRVSIAKMTVKSIRAGQMRRTIWNWTDYHTRTKPDSIVIEKGRGVRCSRTFTGWR